MRTSNDSLDSDEELFNIPEHSVPPQLLNEILNVMVSENWKLRERALQSEPLYFKQVEAIKFIFQLSKETGQPLRVKYLCVELFDKFMTAHIEQTKADIIKRSAKGEKRSNWDQCRSKIVKQVMMRCITCLQVASKVELHRKLISTIKVEKMLHKASLSYKRDSLIEAEMRVLKTLDYRVNMKTPFTYLETMLEILGNNEKRIRVADLFLTCVDLLDLCLLQRRLLYDLLICKVSKSTTVNNQLRRGFLAVEADHLLLGICIIVAASKIEIPAQSDLVMENIVRIANVNYNDVSDFSEVMLELVSNNDVQ